MTASFVRSPGLFSVSLPDLRLPLGPPDSSFDFQFLLSLYHCTYCDCNHRYFHVALFGCLARSMYLLIFLPSFIFHSVVMLHHQSKGSMSKVLPLTFQSHSCCNFIVRNDERKKLCPLVHCYKHLFATTLHL